jgi:AmmeMemoRadiSam system protein A
MSPPSSSAALRQPEPEPAEYAPEERRLLLRLAHDAILAALEKRELDAPPPTPHLAEPRGAFTTLHLGGELRGCVGYVFPVYPLYRTVAETAVAAALQDARFLPVTLEEARRLQIEISVLSPLRAIAAGEVEAGYHGLVITYGMRRGLLLPQVAVEHGWDRITFLEQTCLKAGVPPDAWQRGALIEAFTAEVFGEQD